MRLTAFDKPPRVSADEWMERHMKVKDASFRFASRPFMRLPSRCMSDVAHNCRVVVECCAQVGKTTIMLGYLGWICQQSPDNTLWIMDSEKSYQKVVRNRMRPFLRECVKLPSLQRGVVTLDKSSSMSNVSLGTGRNLMIGSARSASDLCSFPAKYVLCDEVSRFPEELAGEGDPIALLMKRQLTYTNSMTVLASTPTTEAGAIHVNFLVGTQEVWCAVCPCGHHMDIPYNDIDWNDPNNPTYACPKCGEVHTEQDVIKMRHEFCPPRNPTPVTDEYGRRCRSFHIGATLCHTVYTWKRIRMEELEARSKGYSAYRSFVNTTLGDPYVPGYDEQLNIDMLGSSKRYFTKDSLPSWVSTVCIGADTQDNRIEWLALGFNHRGTHVAFIERGVVLGDLKEPQVWNDWKRCLSERVYTTKEGKTLYPAIVCQDAGGHFYHSVLTLGLENPRIRPVKGFASGDRNETPIIRKQTVTQAGDIGRGNGSVVLTQVNTVPTKDLIRQNLILVQRDAKGAPWVISSDPSARFDAVFFDQMNSEIRETSTSGIIRWVKKPSVRNEMLDCTVYAIAAYEIVKMATGNLADDWVEDDVKVPDKDDDARVGQPQPQKRLTISEALQAMRDAKKDETNCEKKVPRVSFRERRKI